MSRVGLAALALALSAVLTCGPSFGQSANPDPARRAAAVRKVNAKMPACKAEADKQQLIFSARRAFMKACLRG
jgi:hypothetical protein